MKKDRPINRLFLTSFLLVFMATLGCTAPPAHAAPPTQEKTPQTGHFFENFSTIRLGTAFSSRPEFIGADRNEFKIFPLLQGAYRINERNQLYFKGTQAGYAHTLTPFIQIGADLTLRSGRQTSEDRRLAGLENVNTAFEAGPWIKARVKKFSLQANVRFDVSGVHDGVLAQLELAHNVKVFKGIRFKTYARTEWGSGDFMDSYFTITPAQALFGRPAFNARSGFYQSAIGTSFSYRLGQNIFLWVDAKLQTLHADAADSSLSFDNTRISGLLGAGYTF